MQAKPSNTIQREARGCVFGFLVKPSVDEAFLYFSTSETGAQRDVCEPARSPPSEALPQDPPIQSLARAIIDAC